MNKHEGNHKKSGGCLVWVLVIFILIVVFGMATKIKSQRGNTEIPSESLISTKATNSSASIGSPSEPLERTESSGAASIFADGLETFSAGEYLFITNEDLDKYGVNMNGAKIYVVTKIDDFKDGMIQSNLSDGLMMSNFLVGDAYESYKSALEEDETIAILGTVSGNTDYKFMGTSLELTTCKVFAAGSDAETYKKEQTDSGLSQYLTVTAAVANQNSDISEEDYKALCETLDYETILRNPDSAKGKYCTVSGTVDQIVEGWFDSYTIYVVDPAGNKWSCVYSYKEGESHLLEEDSVVIYGKCDGTSNVSNLLGKQITLPKINVAYIH